MATSNVKISVEADTSKAKKDLMDFESFIKKRVAEIKKEYEAQGKAYDRSTQLYTIQQMREEYGKYVTEFKRGNEEIANSNKGISSSFGNITDKIVGIAAKLGVVGGAIITVVGGAVTVLIKNWQKFDQSVVDTIDKLQTQGTLTFDRLISNASGTFSQLGGIVSSYFSALTTFDSSKAHDVIGQMRDLFQDLKQTVKQAQEDGASLAESISSYNTAKFQIEDAITKFNSRRSEEKINQYITKLNESGSRNYESLDKFLSETIGAANEIQGQFREFEDSALKLIENKLKTSINNGNINDQQIKQVIDIFKNSNRVDSDIRQYARNVGNQDLEKITSSSIQEMLAIFREVNDLRSKFSSQIVQAQRLAQTKLQNFQHNIYEGIESLDSLHKELREIDEKIKKHQLNVLTIDSSTDEGLANYYRSLKRDLPELIILEKEEGETSEHFAQRQKAANQELGKQLLNLQRASKELKARIDDLNKYSVLPPFNSLNNVNRELSRLNDELQATVYGSTEWFKIYSRITKLQADSKSLQNPIVGLAVKENEEYIKSIEDQQKREQLAIEAYVKDVLSLKGYTSDELLEILKVFDLEEDQISRMDNDNLTHNLERLNELYNTLGIEWEEFSSAMDSGLSAETFYWDKILEKAKEYYELKQDSIELDRMQQEYLENSAMMEELRVQNMQYHLEGLESIISSTSSAFGQLAQDSTNAANAVKALAIAEQVAALATAIHSASAGGDPYTVVARVIAAAGAVMTSIASSKSTTKAFAEGGIVSGQFQSGDRQTIRVNAGEMILNTQQQRNLFKLLDGGVSPSGEVEFKIKGKDLVGVLNNANKYNNLTK